MNLPRVEADVLRSFMAEEVNWPDKAMGLLEFASFGFENPMILALIASFTGFPLAKGIHETAQKMYEKWVDPVTSFSTEQKHFIYGCMSVYRLLQKQIEAEEEKRKKEVK